MSFTTETEQKNKIPFSDVNAICEQGEFITSVYRKPTFSGVYTYLDSFLLDTYKIDVTYTLTNRCFRICSNLSMFHQQLILLRKMNVQKTSLIDVSSCSWTEFTSSKKRFLQLKRSLWD